MSAENNYFNAELAAQFTGFMLILAGGEMDKVVMSKFLYMADREAVRRKGTPLFNDRHFALPEGPICLKAVDGLNGKVRKPLYDRYMMRDGDRLTLVEGLTQADFGEMSEGIYKIARDLWRLHGHKSRAEIVAHTHGRKFPEWRNGNKKAKLAGKGRAEISDEAFAAAAGVDPEIYLQRLDLVRAHDDLGSKPNQLLELTRGS